MRAARPYAHVRPRSDQAISTTYIHSPIILNIACTHGGSPNMVVTPLLHETPRCHQYILVTIN